MNRLITLTVGFAMLFSACSLIVSTPVIPSPEPVRPPGAILPTDMQTSSEGGQYLLSWQNEDCDQLLVTREAVLYGKCGEEPVAAPAVTLASVEKVTRLLGTFTAFEADTPAGKVSIQGSGPNVPTAAEQRMLAEWVQLTYDIASSGRTGAAWGLAFAYSRSGGIGGVCEDVAVYLAGYALVNDCKGTNARMDLTATQLEQVYSWYDAYRPIDYTHSDPAVADAMTITLVMPGKGILQADETTVRVMVGFAADLVEQASFQRQASSADLEAAQAAIREFLTALDNGDYSRAAELYGGHTSVLADWNPDIIDDLPVLLERGCSQNGLMCLTPRSLTYRGPDPAGALQFLVEYNQSDGTLFRLGTCCMEGMGQVLTSFTVRAQRKEGQWLALDLPPYVP